MRSAREAELVLREPTFERLVGASTSPWRDPLSWEPLSRPRQARESLQAWRAWSLVKFPEDVMGPGRPARGTLVSTVPTTPPLYRKVAASIHLGRTQRVFRRGTGTQLTEHEFIVLQKIKVALIDHIK